MLTHEYIKQEFEHVQSLSDNPDRELYLEFFKEASLPLAKQCGLANQLGAMLKEQQLLCLAEYLTRG